MSAPKAVAIALVSLLGVASARAAITCEQVGGTPPRETRLQITIDSPAEGDVIAPRHACGGKVVVTGSYLVTGPPPLYDFYIVIDASGSTLEDSGADVDRDGVLGERDDNIYMAELQAAEDFIGAVDPTASRVALVRFNSSAVVRQQLTSDLPAALATIDVMRTEAPAGGTEYVDALEAARQESVTRGDPANRIQHGVFLSDGVPNESIPEIEAKAIELGAIPMFFDTFALGAIDSTALRRIAEITRGTFTPLATPGDIVSVLPSFAPNLNYSITSAEASSGTPGITTTDEASGTFQAIITLHPGANVATIVLTSVGATPVTVECTVNVTMPEPLNPDAGPSGEACGGRLVTLDASRSSSICSTPIYRWLDCTGAPISAWSTLPTLGVDPCELPCESVSLEMTCEGDTCTRTATTVATCNAVAAPAPGLVSACALTARLTCGGGLDPSLDVDWDFDPGTDADGDGDPANDLQGPGCDVVHEYAAAGRHQAVVWVSDAASGCTSSRTVTFDLAEHPAPSDLSGGTCPTVPANFTCGIADPAMTYWWDFDAASDSDGDGNAQNDRDEMGCDVSHAWATGGLHDIAGWVEDAFGCRWQFAMGTMDVSMTMPPGEVLDLRLSRSGDSVGFSWQAYPGAFGYRVLRGSLVPLQDTGVYDHAADDSASQGTCQVGAATFTDPDDVRDPEAFYYLVTALNDCAGEGPTGFAWDRYQYIARPERIRTASCP